MELLGKCICAEVCLCGSALLAATVYAVNGWAIYINKYKEVGALDEP